MQAPLAKPFPSADPPARQHFSQTAPGKEAGTAGSVLAVATGSGEMHCPALLRV